MPVVELSELASEVSEVHLRVPPPQTRHAWSLGTAEQLCLQILIQARRSQRAFEIGTFNGGTTRLLAETLPDDGRVWTIDLPIERFNTTQRPTDFRGEEVGIAYRSSPVEHKITQLLGDSLDYDFAPYAGSIDLVLVDAAHDYSHGLADTKTALRPVRPSGLILWDDFEPYWHGLVNGICDAMGRRRLQRLSGTSLAVYLANEAENDYVEGTESTTRISVQERQSPKRELPLTDA